MFIQRLITSLILVPLVLAALLYAPASILFGIVLIILLAATKESWQLIPIQSLAVQLSYVILVFIALCASRCYFNYWLIFGLILWLLNCIAIVTFPESQRVWGYPVLVAGVLLILLPLFAHSLAHIYTLPQGKSLIIYLLFLIWASDVGAYITGKGLGEHKLIPKVSPGKSWEGVLGGCILAMIVAGIGYFYYIPVSIIHWFVLALFTVIISIFGDLFISILKRRCHLKDTGTLIPGHGGILDRLDSLIAAAPLFYFGLTLG